MKQLVCWFVGHKRLRLDCISQQPVLSVSDGLGMPLLTIEICARCHLAYWEPAELTEEGRDFVAAEIAAEMKKPKKPTRKRPRP